MEEDKELQAIGKVVEAIASLDVEARTRVLEYVFKRLEIPWSRHATEPMMRPREELDRQQPILGLEHEEHGVRTSSAVPKDIRTLKESKNPRTAIDMAILVAYYLSEHAPSHERKEWIDSKDLTNYFKQAGFKLPGGKPIYTLRNARNAGYLDPAGESGSYRLNPVGYNLAAYGLPRREETKRKTSRNAGKKKSKTKKKGK